MMTVAYQIECEGGGLVKTERPMPKAGRGQVVVRNLATSVNYHDILNLMGVLPNLTCPRVPFSDNCGEIVDVGDDVLGWEIGDRAIAGFFPHWLSGRASPEAVSVCYGDQIDGFLQSHTLVEAKSLVPAPLYLSPAKAATLACAGATAWRSLMVEARLRPGQTVVVQGTGGVSLFALQIAKLCGANVILISSDDKKLAVGEKLGADHLINYTRDPEWDQQVLGITGGGADIIVEIGGADTMQRSINAIAVAGHISIIGVRSGMGKAPPLPIEQVMIKNVTMQGMTVGSIETLRALTKACELSRLEPLVHQTFEIDAASEAMALMESQSHLGKICIEIAN